SSAPDRIEAIRGKTYRLTSKHGPWMIKVASLWEEPDHREEKVLNELVYKLRKAGIPAYIHRQEEETEQVASVDRLGRPRQRSLTAQHSMVAVLAGNYNKPEDKVAQKTLNFIRDPKKFDAKVGVEFNGQNEVIPLVVRTAFLTRNPVLPTDEMDRKEADPLVLSLNSGTEHSLFENKGKFTLVVASFYGQSKVWQSEFGKFDQALSKGSRISLDNAARESWELMKTLRKLKYDAFVYHDQFCSIVTIGEFKSPNDPRIQELYNKFCAKPDVHPKTGQPLTDSKGNPLMLPVNIQFDKDEKPVLVDAPTHAPGTAQFVMNGNFSPVSTSTKNRIGKGWMMDPIPQVLPVPKK
ncbi:MAG: hypothetical protein HY290_19155, partial [Planctomycetia bacterium]|nr:hypothetical protein [Planctomycetia bacterium]